MNLQFLKIKHFFTEMRDICITDIFYLFPCALKWFYHRKIKQDIFHFNLESDCGKKAILFQHGNWKSEDKAPEITLILHGIYSHPLVMLPVAKIAQKVNKGPVFSLYIWYDNDNLESHRSLIKKAVDKVEKMGIKGDDSAQGIILVGHSMGAIEAVYTAFVEKDKRILSVISIAGRLKIVNSIYNPCPESLKSTLNKIEKEVKSTPDLPLYQIVGRRDWNAPIESTLIRKKEGYYHIVEKGMHLNILFYKEIYKKLAEFLEKTH